MFPEVLDFSFFKSCGAGTLDDLKRKKKKPFVPLYSGRWTGKCGCVVWDLPSSPTHLKLE